MANTTEALTLRLALLNLPLPPKAEASEGLELAAPMLARQRELSRRLSEKLCPADQRIQNFLDAFLADAPVQPKLPTVTLILDEPGLARELSLPAGGDHFTSDLLSSYRLANGVLHNPANDRRTTAGVFHISEGGLPIQDDKLALPKDVYARLLDAALQPPAGDMVLPWTAESEYPATCHVSLLLRPLVVPPTPGAPARTMETRFIVPGGLVCNLDFVEGIFGNGGDPQLPENDAALDPLTWTGHSGCVILAPHLTKLKKKDLGLPHVDDATTRQQRDGMCWSDPDELYNMGQAFKAVARDERGVVVTVIADNYFGYCKKEVKTQIGYSANLFGQAEEEHAGGAMCYPAYNLGQEFTDTYTPAEYSLAEVIDLNDGRFEAQPEGHAIDTEIESLLLVPSGATYSLRTQTVEWQGEGGGRSSIPLREGTVYMSPNGYRVYSKQREADPTQWHLVGVSPVVTQCHKPATVSGGGKSEISKSLLDAFVFANAWTADFDNDIEQVQQLIDTDWSQRFRDESANTDHRGILSPERTLGSVIKLLTPSPDYTDAFNATLEAIAPHVKELLFLVKKYDRPEWDGDWRSHFSVGVINGRPGNIVRLDGDKVIVNMLRVGFERDGSWRLFSLRHDFSPCIKVQSEDDITASAVVPQEHEPLDFSRRTGARMALANATSDSLPLSRKFVKNVEQLLFQRPDDAIHRGYDKQAERDLSRTDTFLSNFEPLTRADARAIVADAVGFSLFTAPMQDMLRTFAEQPDQTHPSYVVCSSEPRLVGGKPSKNPRYLQVRPDVANPVATAVADVSSHLLHHKPLAEFMPLPIDVVAAGRRNNPPEEGVPALCSYNPLHYMELPELFMEYISSMTGKSPSTTGAGSEGALTKGPFNMLPSIIDLNAALLSYVLTGYDGWVSGAGYVGPYMRVDHDFSLLVPEVFSRMSPAERSAKWLVEQGFLDKIGDFEHDGTTHAASRLGYRINQRFVNAFFGRIFLHPDTVFTAEMLQPELQDAQIYADSVDTIVQTHQRVAQTYFDDGTAALAVPPLKALLEIMAHGQSAECWTLDTPEFRNSFERETVLTSEWYAERLSEKQSKDVERLSAAAKATRDYLGDASNADPAARMNLAARQSEVEAELKHVRSHAYVKSLAGTLGLQPL